MQSVKVQNLLKHYRDNGTLRLLGPETPWIDTEIEPEDNVTVNKTLSLMSKDPIDEARETQPIIVTGQRISFDDGREDEIFTGAESLMKHETECEVRVIGGAAQQKTLFFTVHEPGIQGLTIVCKTYKGIIGPFTSTTKLGNFEPGDHSHSFDNEVVPDGILQRGHYKSYWQYIDADGKVLLSYVSHFKIVKKSHYEQCSCLASEG